jgi:phenylpropionate dioxygenase-like ring-hydroxylating dioxygenase large terminal subunit
MPALLSEEIAEPDSPPVRVKILNEELIAFRDTNGDVGLIDNNCPHRRASLFFGRNEECGLRCVYHGWKFDTNGDCVDMPSEPAESNFKDKVKVKAYSTEDWGGYIWAYMGPAESMPELPEVGWAMVPESHRKVSRRLQENNFVQGIEGGIDSSHISFLHFGLPPVVRDDPARAGHSLSNIDAAPHFIVKTTDYGFVYGANREAENDSYYWRLTPFMLPFFTVIPGGTGNPDERTYSGHGWVPADDESCWMFTYSWNASRPLNEGEGHGASFLEKEPRTMRAVMNKDNDYGIDREVQRTKTFTGIEAISIQDSGIQESMGAICDRTKEHLGTSDSAVIAMRRMYLQGCRDLLEGKEPFVPKKGSAYRVRSVADVMDKKVTFEETTEKVAVGAT